MISIWVNGTFDVIHMGHIEMLKYAKTLSPHVIVGIDSDKRVKELKGVNRPFNNQNDRKKLLESIKYVDAVVIFNTDQELEYYLAKSRATRMILGAEYKDKKIVGKDIVDEIIFFERIAEHSSTNLIEKIDASTYNR